MAKAITMYEAEDGTRFGTLERAEQHDELCRVLEDVMAQLRPVPEGDFGNERRGYVQQDPAAVRAVKVRLVEIAAALPHMGWFQERLDAGEAAEVHPMSYGGRIMSECAPRPLGYAWSRLARIDDRGREWEQPYFALNPGKGCQHPYGEEPAA